LVEDSLKILSHAQVTALHAILHRHLLPAMWSALTQVILGDLCNCGATMVANGFNDGMKRHS
jgi:hypothetical protein